MHVQVVQHAARQPELTVVKDIPKGRVRGDAEREAKRNGHPVVERTAGEPPAVEPPVDPAIDPAAGAPPADTGLTPPKPNSNFTDWLPKHMVIAALVLLPIWLAAFNGQWRIGSDSALYRVVARSIAEAGTYSHGVLPETHVFPGLPVLLAGVQLLFGEGDLAPLLLMNLAAITVLVVTYKLIRTHFEPWVAACVAFGMALNGELLTHAQQILTDVPFLLGVVTAWWGWEIVQRRGDRPGRRVTGAALLVLGLALAASLRPTFWVLAAAWLLVSTWKAVFGTDRRIHILAVGLVAGVGLLLVAVDPRFHGLNFLNGGYEMRAVEAFGELDGGVFGTLMYVLGRQLTHGFFGEPMSPFGLIWATPLLIGLVMVTRRIPLWGVTAWLLLGTTVVLSADPRYYLMILPVLWLGWVLCAQKVWHWTDAWLRRPDGAAWRDRLPPDFAGFAMCLTILVVPLINSAAIGNLIWEQRQPDFLGSYADGRYVPIVEAADVIAAHTAADAIIVAPEPRVLSYYARRTVIGDNQFFRTGGKTRAMALFSEVEPDWCVFPAAAYRASDPHLSRLLDNSKRDAPIVAVEPVQMLDLVVGENQWYLAKPAFRSE